MSTDNQHEPSSNVIAQALKVFSSLEASVFERKAALTTLITGKFLPKNANDKNVLTGRTHLTAITAESENPDHKLLAIAESVRLTQVVKRWAPELPHELAPAFSRELPPIVLLPEADDRLNIARACSLFRADWLPSYLAKSIVNEETGEKARKEMMTSLFMQEESLATIVNILTLELGGINPSTEAPGDTIGRRLTRILSALRECIVDSEISAGVGAGAGLFQMTTFPLDRVGFPQDPKVKLDLAKEALLTIHDIVRTRISLATDPQIYKVASFFRGFFTGRKWPNELSDVLGKLVTDVSEALVLLGRQGLCDQALLDQLKTLSNYQERAKALAEEIASQHPELPEDVRDWLKKGRMKSSTNVITAASDVRMSNADQPLGLSLHTARKLKTLTENLGDSLTSSLEIFEPLLVSKTQELLKIAKVLSTQIEHTSAIRNITLYGVEGEEIEMSTKYFEIIDSDPRQRMIVKQPAIVRQRQDGTIGEVIVKGLVN